MKLLLTFGFFLFVNCIFSQIDSTEQLYTLEVSKDAPTLLFQCVGKDCDEEQIQQLINTMRHHFALWMQTQDFDYEDLNMVLLQLWYEDYQGFFKEFRKEPPREKRQLSQLLLINGLSNLK